MHRGQTLPKNNITPIGQRAKYAAPEVFFRVAPPPGAAYVRVRPPPTGGWAVAQLSDAPRAHWCGCAAAARQCPRQARRGARLRVLRLACGGRSARSLAHTLHWRSITPATLALAKARAPRNHARTAGMAEAAGAAAGPLANPKTPWPEWPTLATGQAQADQVRRPGAQLRRSAAASMPVARSLATLASARRSPAAVATSSGAGLANVAARYSASWDRPGHRATRDCCIWYYLLVGSICTGRIGQRRSATRAPDAADHHRPGRGIANRLRHPAKTIPGARHGQATHAQRLATRNDHDTSGHPGGG